jgi:predicted secreted protein
MATHGNKRKMYLTTAASGSTYAWLAGEQSNNLNLDSEMLEATDKSSQWRQYVPGMKGGTAEVTVFANNTDAGQISLLKSLFKGDKVFCFVGELGSNNTPSEGETFEAYVSSISTPAENGSLVTRSISLQITGEVNHLPELK